MKAISGHIVAALAVTAFLAVAANAVSEGMSFGGAAFIESFKSGGSAELGFSLLEGEGLSLRDYVTFTGAGLRTGAGAGYGILELSDKFAFGGNFNDRFRAYGFAEGGFGLYSGHAADGTPKEFFAAPFYWEAKGGGGFEFKIDDRQCYYVEYGGGFGASTGSPLFAGVDGLESGYALIRVGNRLAF